MRATTAERLFWTWLIGYAAIGIWALTGLGLAIHARSICRQHGYDDGEVSWNYRSACVRHPQHDSVVPLSEVERD